MLRKRWLALAATALCGWSTSSVHAQARLLPPEPLEPAQEQSARREKKLPPVRIDPAVVRAANPETKSAAPATVDAPAIAVNETRGNGGHGGGLSAGGSFYLLRPFVNNNAAFVTTTGIGAATTTVNSEDFNWNYQPAFAGWLGWTSDCGVGFRGRYFQFDHDSETINGTLSAGGAATTTITPPQGLSPLVGVPPRGFQSPGILLQDLRGADVLSAHSDLRIQTIDGEATFAREWRRFSMVLGAGGRYLQMSQNYRGSLVNAIDPANTEISLLHSGHNFYGGGPTLSGQASWRIGNSGLSVVGMARGSFLVGSAKQTSVFSENITDAVNGDQNNLAISQSREEVNLPILEIEGGLEYGRIVGRTRVIVRGAAVNHVYFDAGSASGRSGNLSLFGVQVSAGVEY